MVVTAAIAAMSGCVQGLVDVRRDSQLVGPALRLIRWLAMRRNFNSAFRP